jgi:hypothetical protein
MAIIELVDREGELRPARPPPERLAALVQEVREHVIRANTESYMTLKQQQQMQEQGQGQQQQGEGAKG